MNRKAAVIRIPLFEALSVNGYGLYPGEREAQGLQTKFKPGLSLVLGANGLGKSTLVLLLYRMCTGPYDIPAGAGRAELGSSQIREAALKPKDRKTFAARVHDGAHAARATLELRLGETKVSISRDLKSLSLTSLIVDGQPQQAFTEKDYQRVITELAGLGIFADWILVLRYLVFYFDDRRSLVWDPNAQRQMLRLLFLPPAETEKYLSLETDVLKRATYVRNLSAALARQRTDLNEQEKAATKSTDLRRHIDQLTATQEAEQAELTRIQDSFHEQEAQRYSARLEALQAADERESAYRALEHHRLMAIHEAFPSQVESVAYILGQLVSGDQCLTCGTSVPELALELRALADEHRCVICKSPLSSPSSNEIDADEVTRAREALKSAEERLEAATEARTETETEHQGVLQKMRELESSIAQRNVTLDALYRQLPESDKKLQERRSNFAALDARLAEYREELNSRKSRYNDFIAGINLTIVERRRQIKDMFAIYARDFLVETCVLVGSTHKEQVGQWGLPTEFSIFEVNMTGTDFESPVIRNGPEQVSESQREFIDLAFRMALISVASEGGQGSLIVDAPEASLDAVFAPRAAQVLARFADPDAGNHVILTSNLVDGQLIPTLMRLAGINRRDTTRIINLFRIASPTAATRKLHSEYETAIQRLFDEG
ncbi:hypothetical protein GCM10023085_35990 [Actinomadura viridis]|uniref:Nuclease SbcCD subunit C n=1 Tax=Actinomadura viridis TaxID=58110 RepID=A0A931DFJ7_9ACTN|nr:AAA family ATPase [Actinomadura viridis]MBG6087864.1 putative coiled-coil protein SlyX/energy-coupling factor transporter ATP-binding protein EcfA2 [Actinomadura viridis]